VWLGIAEDATRVAHELVRQRARLQPGRVPREAARLERALGLLDLMRADIFRALEEYARAASEDPASLGRPAYARRINEVKLAASELVVEVVTEALRAGGIASYRNGEEASLGRHLRDAHSAALMVSNDRLRETNAALLLTIKESS
jgi:acyl-CoA dehydrogenase